ncbi:MAG: GC-type dockerin domain-anchored protein [Phycisphaerales bacterium JB061]
MARSSRSRSVRTVTALALVACAGTAQAGPEPTPIPVTLDKVQTFGVTSLGEVTSSLPDPGNTNRGTECQLANTYASETFAGGTYLVQAGFVEGEVMAAQYTLPASVFPIRIDLIEALIGTAGTSIQTTTEWTVLVWDGPPNTGTLVASYSSDDVILPHIVIPPGPAQAVNVAFSIDPGDPEQIFINNNSGTNTFTIGFRIDQHQSQSGNGCFTPPPQNQNAFPMTDNSGVASPTGNWINAIDCGVFGCPPGWSTFQSFPALCTPSGDWMLQATWTSFTCEDQTGACCDGSAECFDLTEAECLNINGAWQGAGTQCVTTTCPIPEGACCLTNGNCLFITEDSCDLIGGTWQGANVECNGSLCPIGAACLPDGTCVEGVTALEAAALGGTFLGVGTTCLDADCPQPTGACCITTSSNCLILSEENCNLIPDAVWLGMGTICDGDGDTIPDGTCIPPDPCIADTNGDGMLSPADFSAWVAAFNAQAPECDQNTDGACSPADFSAWVANYNAGC